MYRPASRVALFWRSRTGAISNHMRIQTQLTADRPKIQEKRRGVRMNSRVPVVIEWENASGEKFLERAFTRIVGPYGCMVVLPEELEIDQRVQVTNVATGQANPALIVSKGNIGPEGCELGVELSEPPFDFWGLDL
jgi:hypothetical protein